MRAIGFSEAIHNGMIQDLLDEALDSPTFRTYTSMEGTDGCLAAQFQLEIGKDFGIVVCGSFDEEDQFLYEYYFPYVYTGRLSTTEEVSVERRIDTDSYAGVCDDLKVGVTLIFRLQNTVDYLKREGRGIAPAPTTGVSLAALSIEGSVMLPIQKTAQDKKREKHLFHERMRLMHAARRGDESAMRDLTMEDMDNYAILWDRIQVEDVYSLVDNSFMPYGVECDLYAVLGEILRVDQVRNPRTGEQLYKMVIDCNDLTFDLLINSKDLYGEPAPGRRFKGVIWLQGSILYSDAFH